MSLQDQLLAYYKLDQRVRSMSSRLESAKRRQAAQTKKKEQLEQQAAELDTQLKKVKAHAATLESEATGKEQRVTELRDKLNSVTSNKEYSALLVEVNTLKLAQGKAEEEALESMTQVEALTGQLEELNSRVEEQTKIVAGSAKEVVDATEEIGDQLTELTAQRDTAAEPIADTVLKQFNRLCHVHDGEAMAGISEQNRRRMEYTCDGCFTMISVETVNGLLSRPDDVTTCGTCERILFIDDEIREMFAAKAK